MEAIRETLPQEVDPRWIIKVFSIMSFSFHIDSGVQVTLVEAGPLKPEDVAANNVVKRAPYQLTGLPAVAVRREGPIPDGDKGVAATNKSLNHSNPNVLL